MTRYPNAARPDPTDCILTITNWESVYRRSTPWDLTIETSERAPWVESWDARRAWARYLELSERYGRGLHVYGSKDELRQAALDAGWKPPTIHLDGGSNLKQGSIL